MPKLNKSFHLEITIEQFLEACSPLELQELDLLIQSPRYQNKIKVSQIPEVSKNNQDAPDWIKKLGVGNFQLNPSYEKSKNFPGRKVIKYNEYDIIRESVILHIKNIIREEVDPEKISLVTSVADQIEDKDWKRVVYDGKVLFAMKIDFDKKGFLWSVKYREVTS